MKPLLLLLVTFALAACDRFGAPPKFARENNPDRKKHSLPIIEDTWQNYNTGNNVTEAAWSAPGFDPNSGRAIHSGKKVLYPNGKLEAEEDYYYSGKTFDRSTIDPDSGKAWEHLTVHYDYLRPETPWTCYHIHSGAISTISLSAAEELLKTWGLRRLSDNQ